jgi:hypothetical protein
MPKPIAFFSPPASTNLACVICGSAFGLLACGGSKPVSENRPVVLNLDSLNRTLASKDSVESNVIFYEDAYRDYHARYPGVDKQAYLRIARGKDQEFCLFKPDPAKICLDNGDKFNDLGLKPPARDAYHAGLLSEQYNETDQNVKLWGSMGQLAIEEKDYEAGRKYMGKILETQPNNKWARKLLSSIPKE